MSSPILDRERLANLARPRPFLVTSIDATVLLRGIRLPRLLEIEAEVAEVDDETLRFYRQALAFLVEAVVDPDGSPLFATADEVEASLDNAAIFEIAKAVADRCGVSVKSVDEAKKD